MNEDTNTEKLNELQTGAASTGVALTLVNVAVKALGFITVPIFTRLMTKAEFGAFNNCSSWQLILITLTGLEAYSTLSRARFDYDEDDLVRYQFSMIILGLIISLCFALFLIFAPAAATQLFGLEMRYLWMLFGYLCTYPAFALYLSYEQVRYRWHMPVLITGITTLVSMLMSVVLVIYLPDRLMGRVAGQYLPFTVVGIGIIFWYGLQARAISLRDWKYALPICVPLMLAAAANQILLFGNRIVVSHLAGDAVTADIGLTMTIANIAVIIITALNSTWSPWLMDCIHEHDYERARRTLTLLLRLVFALVLGMGLLAPELVRILGGSSYESARLLIPACASSCYFYFVSMQYLLIESYEKKLVSASVLVPLAALIHVLACIVLARIGVWLVGVAGFISYSALIATQIYLCARLGYADLFPLPMIVLPLLVLALVLPLEMYLVENPSLTLVRYLLLLILTLSVVLPLKSILSLLVRKEHAA